MGQSTGLVSRRITEHMRGNTLREIIRDDLIVGIHLAELRAKALLATDGAADHAVVCEVVEPFILRIALCGAEKQG